MLLFNLMIIINLLSFWAGLFLVCRLWSFNATKATFYDIYVCSQLHNFTTRSQ